MESVRNQIEYLENKNKISENEEIDIMPTWMNKLVSNGVIGNDSNGLNFSFKSVSFS